MAASFAILVLLIFSALVSGAEVAYFSIGQRRIPELKKRHGESLNLVIRLLEKPADLLATILIANNLFNIGIIVTSWFLSEALLQGQPWWLVFLVNVVGVTFLIVLFGEIMPKIYASHNSISFARLMSKPLWFLRRFLRPASFLMVRSSDVIDRKLSRQGMDAVSADDLDQAIDIAAGHSTSEEEINMLKGIVKFGNITVKQIMCPRIDVETVDISDSYTSIFSSVVESGFSRIPAIDGDLDKVVGILYAKDLLAHLNEPPPNWTTMLRPVFYVPESKRIEELLREFQLKRIHFAVVVDEYGGSSGVVTLEDVMEQVIGEISDEFDEKNANGFHKVSEGTYMFEGKTLIHDFCRALDIKPELFDEVRGDSDSLGGLLTELKGEIPKPGDSVKHAGFVFTVVHSNRRRVDRVKVEIMQEEEAESHA